MIRGAIETVDTGLLGRGALALAVACMFTFASLLLVSWMNDDESAHPHAPEPSMPHTVAVAAAPPVAERPKLPSPEHLSPSTSSPAAAAQVSPPAPAAPNFAGLAAELGPGTLGIGRGGALPSLGTLPSTDIDATEPSTMDTPARPRSRPAPRYPPIAQRRGLEGYVTLRLRIDTSGRVQDAVIVKSEPPGVFDDAATSVAHRYRFDPARRGGKPVAASLEQTIRFELEQ